MGKKLVTESTRAGRTIQIINLLEIEYPEAGTMLKYNSVFELLVAVILSAQSTDEQVNRVTAELFKKYCNPVDFAESDLEELESAIRGVGLHRGKAKNLKEMSQMLLHKHDGKVPDDFDSLLELPGVGRKTANVMLAVGFGKPGLGVDTHVHRVSNRMGLVNTKNTDKTEKELKELIPVEWWGKSHHLFIWHGRKVCRARNPRCESCVIENLCSKNID